MLIFEAWDLIFDSAEYACEEIEVIDGQKEAIRNREALKICDGLMNMLMMKLDDMDGGKMTITRDEIWEAICREE